MPNTPAVTKLAGVVQVLRVHRAVTSAVAVVALGVSTIVAFPVHARVPLIAMLLTIAFIGLRSPKLGLAVVVLGLPLHSLAMRILQVDFGIGGVDLLLASAWKEVALAAALLSAVVARRGDRLAGWLLPDRMVLGLAALFAIYILVSPALVPALYGFRTLSVPLLAYIGWRLARPSAVTTDRVRLAVVVEGLAMAALAVIQSFGFGWSFILHYYTVLGSAPAATYTAEHVTGPRAIATFTSPNEFGLFMVLPIVLALASALDPAKDVRHRAAYSFAVGMMIFGQALSISRSGLIAMIVAAAVVASVWARGIGRLPAGRRAAIPVALALLVSSAAVAGTYARIGAFDLAASTVTALVGPRNTSAPASSQAAPGTEQPSGTPTTTTPIPSPTERPGDSSILGHIDSFISSAAIVLANPLGAGLGTAGSRVVPVSIGTFAQPQFFSEVAYFLVSMQVGWLGALLLAAAIGTAARRAYRRGGGTFTGLGIPAAAILVGAGLNGLLIPMLVEPAPALPIWSIAAMAVGAGLTPKAGAVQQMAPEITNGRLRPDTRPSSPRRSEPR